MLGPVVPLAPWDNGPGGDPLRMTAEDQERKRQADALYQQYGKPLEADHRGQFVAISPEGKTLLGTDLVQVLDAAAHTFGPGNFIFKVGEKAVGKWL